MWYGHWRTGSKTWLKKNDPLCQTVIWSLAEDRIYLTLPANVDNLKKFITNEINKSPSPIFFKNLHKTILNDWVRF